MNTILHLLAGVLAFVLVIGCLVAIGLAICMVVTLNFIGKTNQQIMKSLKLKLIIGVAALLATVSTNAASLGDLMDQFFGTSAYIVGGEKGISSGNKDSYEVFAMIAHPVNTNFVDLSIGIGGGELFTTQAGQPNTMFQLSGNISASEKLTPLSRFSYTNWTVTVGAYQITGSPLNGGNAGNLLIAQGTYVEPLDLDFHIKAVPVSFAAGALWQTQHGTGNHDGQYVGGYLKFDLGSPGAGGTAAAFNGPRDAVAWTTRADNLGMGYDF